MPLTRSGPFRWPKRFCPITASRSDSAKRDGRRYRIWSPMFGAAIGAVPLSLLSYENFSGPTCARTTWRRAPTGPANSSIARGVPSLVHSSRSAMISGPAVAATENTSSADSSTIRTTSAVSEVVTVSPVGCGAGAPTVPGDLRRSVPGGADKTRRPSSPLCVTGCAGLHRLMRGAVTHFPPRKESPVSNIGYGQDRPYGAIDDDDDFMEEWRASWEPAAHTHIDDVIEPVSVAPAEPARELEHVYDEGLYAPAPAEPEPVTPAAEYQPAPAVDPYDIESVHAGAASDTALSELSSAVVSAHPLTPVAPPEPVSEPEAVPEPEAVAEPEAIAEPEAASDPEATAETVSEAEAMAQPETMYEPEAVAEPEATAPQPEPLAAPDEVDDLELVDWEPQPLSASSEVLAPGETPEAGAFAEPEPDHSLGLTGAAAAALA